MSTGLARTMACGIVAVALAATGCGKKGGGAPEGPPDGYKSPYVGAPDVPAAGTPAAEPAKAPEAAPAAAAPEPAKARTHPAAAERPYPLLTADELAKDADEKEIFTFLADPKQGGKALERMKKDKKKGAELGRRALLCSQRETRLQAALILGNLEDSSKETIKALSDAVLLDPDGDARALAAKAFIKIRKPEVIPVLIRSLKEDPFEPARANAAWALGDIGGAQALQPLRDALKDPDTWVRLRAVSGLKRLKAKAAVPDLIEHLADTNQMVRERAREALKDITGQDKGEDPAAWKR